MQRLGILISGRGSNMGAILRHVQRRRVPIRPAVVISNHAEAAGLRTAQKMGVPTRVIPSRGFGGRRQEYDRMLIGALEEHGVTGRSGLVCLAGFMRIVGPELIKRYRNRILNIHPALLPAFPGLDAQGQAIRYGARVSGCTVHFVDEGVDTGPVLLQSAVMVASDDTAESLSKKILRREHAIYPRAVELIARGQVRVLRGRVLISGRGSQKSR